MARKGNLKNEKVILKYKIGEHPTVKNRIVIAFDGTGLDLKNEEQLHFIKVISEVMASQMYAKANGIAMDKVKFNEG